jgi:predicted lipoprotein
VTRKRVCNFIKEDGLRQLSAGCPVLKMKVLKSCSIMFSIVVLAGIFSCKIVKYTAADQAKAREERNGVTFGDSAFDAKKYASDIWDTKVLSLIEQTAVNLPDLISGLRSDEKKTCTEYGYRVGEEGSFYNFAVKGKIKILAVHTESRNGTLDGDMEPYDGKKDITVQIGPVFKGSAIRDYLNFISINTFENQVEFAKLGTELNMRVRDTVVKDIDFVKLSGKECTLTGVFTLDNGVDSIVLIPVKITGVEK